MIFIFILNLVQRSNIIESKIDNIAQSMFHYNENNSNKNVSSSQPLKYSEAIFRSAPFPVIWLDEQGDVRWNRPAQYEMLNYLLEKQFSTENISTCLTRQLFILEQWASGGFFSRIMFSLNTSEKLYIHHQWFYQLSHVLTLHMLR